MYMVNSLWRGKCNIGKALAVRSWIWYLSSHVTSRQSRTATNPDLDLQLFGIHQDLHFTDGSAEAGYIQCSPPNTWYYYYKG